MPIRVECSCGQVLKVADTMAGKSGKCPKCQNVVRIPAAGGASESATKPTLAAKSSGVAKSAGASKPVAEKAVVAAGANPNRMDSLFEEAGLVKKVGNFCPNCDTPYPTGALLCTRCGLNLQTGEKLAAHETEAARAEFRNKHLNEAAQMMRREDDLQSRTLNAGTPWWVMLCVLLSGISIAAAGIIIVDGRLTEPQPTSTPIGKLQALPVGLMLSLVLAINCILVTNFAHFAVVVAAFREKTSYGWMSLLVPMYSGYYGISRFRQLSGTVVAYVVAVLIGIPIIIYLAMELPKVQF